MATLRSRADILGEEDLTHAALPDSMKNTVARQSITAHGHDGLDYKPVR